MLRRDFLQITGISALAAGVPIALADNQGQLSGIQAPRGLATPGVLEYTALAETEITGSKNFPVRPLRQTARHGDLVHFVMRLPEPADGKSNARLNILQHAPLQGVETDMIKYRIRVGEPDVPYFLFWKVAAANVYVYTAPGCLIKRACAILRNGGDLMPALDHVRFAALLNAAARKDDYVSQAIVDAEEAFQIALRTGNREVASEAINKYFASAKEERL